MRGKELKNGKVAGKDEVIREVIKCESELLIDCVWKLFNIAFEISVVAKNWRIIVNASLCKRRGLNPRTKEVCFVKCDWENLCWATTRQSL